MNARDAAKAEGLWAITSYFNPVGYRHRLANYRIFRRRLTVPLVAVELAYGRDFELGEGDAEILVQLRAEAVLWQKERLLNLALEALPEDCGKVAWLDCDIILEDGDWPSRAGDLLDRTPLVQLFNQMHYLPCDVPHGAIGPDVVEARRKSVVSAIASGLPVVDCFDDANHRVYGLYTPGFAWAARRELLERHGFYDRCIVGAGDRAMAAAAYGYFDHVILRHRMVDREASRYLEWARPFCEAVAGAIGFVEGHLFHLWHGSLEDRRMRERHQGLSPFQFDALDDITLAENATWRWSSDKPEMHAYVRNHFVSRREDG